MSMSVLQVSGRAASPPMSLLHVRINTMLHVLVSMLHVHAVSMLHVYAERQCCMSMLQAPFCMSMSVLQVHVHAAVSC